MYTYSSRIAYSETGADSVLTPVALVDYFQNCSTFQTQDGPVPMEELSRRGILWVINSWQIDMMRLPRLGERVVIGTVPYEMKGFIGLRNFFMDTADTGERLAIANSTWSLIDRESGRPVRVTKDICDAYPLDEMLPMELLPRKLVLPDASGHCPEGCQIMDSSPFTVSTHHLDSNRHVNNGQYIRMAMDAADECHAFPEDNNTIRRIRAEYHSQARLQDKIRPRVYVNHRDDAGLTVTVAINGRDGSPYTVVELWT